MNNADLTVSVVQQPEEGETKGLITLTNVSAKSMLINARFAINSCFAPASRREISLEIHDSDDNILVFNARVNPAPMGSRYVKELAPKQEIFRKFDLSNYFTLPCLGKLEVFAVYENALELPDVDLWKGRIQSDQSIFSR